MAEIVNLENTEEPNETLTIAGRSSNGQLHQLPIQLLQMILKMLYPWDMWDLRSVNTTWRTLTSLYLREEGPILRLVTLSVEGPIHRCQHPHLTLQKLNSCLESASTLSTLPYFPSNSVRLHGVNLCASSVQKFLTLFGPHLKSISLDACASLIHHNNDLQTLRHLLLDQAPNLEYFSMHNHWTISDLATSPSSTGSPPVILGSLGHPPPTSVADLDLSPVLFPPNCSVQLPHLKTLGFGLTATDQRTLEQILAVAVNLKECRFWTFGPFFDLDRFSQTQKIHTIKDMTLNLVPYKLDFFDKMADFDVQLSSMELSLEFIHESKSDLELMDRASRILNRILASSQKSLKKIKEFQPIGYIPGVSMPKSFDNLKCLHLTNNYFEVPDNIPIHEPIFPTTRRIHLASTFPKLTSVRLSFIKVDQDRREVEAQAQEGAGDVPQQQQISGHDFWSKYFPFSWTDNVFTTVRHLRTHSMRGDYIQGMSIVFPNVTHLEIDKFGPEVIQVSEEVWRFMGKLKRLSIWGINMAKTENQGMALDSILTGFTVETCRDLMEKKEYGLREEEVKRLRVKGSILDLKELQYLNMHFYHDEFSFDDVMGAEEEDMEVEPEAELEPDGEEALQGENGEEEGEEEGNENDDDGEEEVVLVNIMNNLEEGNLRADLEMEAEMMEGGGYEGDIIEVRIQDGNVMRRWGSPVLSKIVGYYAFQLKPNLKVKLTVAESGESEMSNARGALEDIASFVSSVEVVPDILRLMS